MAETLLFEAVNNPHQVGMVGSLARRKANVQSAGEADVSSDIDMCVFLDNEKARRFSLQTSDVWDPNEPETVYKLIGIPEEKVKEILQEGMPGEREEKIKLAPADLHLIVLSRTPDETCLRQHERKNGPDFLPSLANDLLIYDPPSGDFVKPESNWLFNLRKQNP